MADILTQFQARLSRNPELTTDKPTAYKSLVRTERETADYHKWKQSALQLKMCSWLREELLKSNSRNTHDGIDFYNSGNTKGFRMHPALSPFPDEAVRHLFDYLKNRLVQYSYQAQSEMQIFERGYWQEKKMRHILKPLRTEGDDFAQITLELLFKDNHLCQLSMSVSVPNTDLPRPTDDFATLFEALLA